MYFIDTSEGTLLSNYHRFDIFSPSVPSPLKSKNITAVVVIGSRITSYHYIYEQPGHLTSITHLCIVDEEEAQKIGLELLEKKFIKSLQDNTPNTFLNDPKVYYRYGGCGYVI